MSIMFSTLTEAFLMTAVSSASAVPNTALTGETAPPAGHHDGLQLQIYQHRCEKFPTEHHQTAKKKKQNTTFQFKTTAANVKM